MPFMLLGSSITSDTLIASIARDNFTGVDLFNVIPLKTPFSLFVNSQREKYQIQDVLLNILH